MALWKPDKNAVGKNEYIGRRLFPRTPLRGAQDQTQPTKSYELYHFEEKRDREVSIDRLGATSVDKKVKAYLNPRCHNAATKLQKSTFKGWAVIQAKILQSPPRSYQVNPSPLPAQPNEPLSENPFHGHIRMPDHLSPYEMAVMLKHAFEENYHHEPSDPVPSAKHTTSYGWLRRLWRWIRSHDQE